MLIIATITIDSTTTSCGRVFVASRKVFPIQPISRGLNSDDDFVRIFSEEKWATRNWYYYISSGDATEDGVHKSKSGFLSDYYRLLFVSIRWRESNENYCRRTVCTSPSAAYLEGDETHMYFQLCTGFHKCLLPDNIDSGTIQSRQVKLSQCRFIHESRDERWENRRLEITRVCYI